MRAVVHALGGGRRHTGGGGRAPAAHAALCEAVRRGNGAIAGVVRSPDLFAIFGLPAEPPASPGGAAP